MMYESTGNLRKFLEELRINGKSQLSNRYAVQHFERYQKTIEYLDVFDKEKEMKILDLGASLVFCYLLSSKVTGEFFGTSPEAPKFSEHGSGESREVSVTIECEKDQVICKVIKNINLETEDLPYESEMFDLVCCNDIIEHLIYSPTKMLGEIFRVLKKNGFLCLTTDNVNNLLKVARVLLNKQTYFRLYKHSIYCRHNREYLKHELEDLLTGMGFNLIKSIYFNYNPFRYTADLKYRLGYDFLYCFSHLPFLRKRKKHIFVLAQRGEKLNWYYPNWLYG